MSVHIPKFDPTEVKTEVEVLKLKPAIESKIASRKEAMNKPKEDAFDKKLAERNPICNKISDIFLAKLDIVNKSEAIQKLVKEDKFVVNKAIYTKMRDENGNLTNQTQEEYKPFLDYRPVITDAMWNDVKTNIESRLKIQRQDIATIKKILKEGNKEKESLRGKLRSMEDKFKAKGEELTAADIDNNEEYRSLKSDVIEIEDKVEYFTKLLRASEITESELMRVLSHAVSKSVELSEPIVGATALLNMLTIFDADPADMDEVALSILNDPALEGEITTDRIKSIINTDSVDSVNVLKLQMESQEAYKDELVNELLDRYYDRSVIDEFLEVGKELRCLADIQKELIAHLYANPNDVKAEDDLEAFTARKKDENGNIIKVDDTDLSAIPVLLQNVDLYTSGGHMEQTLLASMAVSDALGEIYFPLYKTIIEPYGAQMFDKVTELSKKILLFMYILISCFKMDSLNLITTLVFRVDQKPEENKGV